MEAEPPLAVAGDANFLWSESADGALHSLGHRVDADVGFNRPPVGKQHAPRDVHASWGAEVVHHDLRGTDLQLFAKGSVAEQRVLMDAHRY